MGAIRGKHETLFRTLIKNEWVNKIPVELKEEFVDTLDNIRTHYSDSNVRVSPGLTSSLRAFNVEPENLKIVIIADAAKDHSGIAIRGTGQLTEAEQVFSKMLQEGVGHGDLLFDDWQKQGVMFLPTAFTSHVLPPKSHKKMWEDVLKKFIQIIDVQSPCWIILGEDNYHLEKSIGIMCADIKAPALKEANLGELQDADIFNGANNIVDFLSKAPKVKW
jgi:uracil DNA glycosylase